MQNAALARRRTDRLALPAAAGAARSCSPRPCGRSPAAGFRGANVTIPHKARGARRGRPPRAQRARAIGAANTLLFEPDGRDRGRQHRRTGADRRAAVPDRRPHARSCSGRAAARGPPCGRCSTRARPRCASGTAPPSGPRGCAPSSAAARCETPSRPICSSTARPVGWTDRRMTFKQLPLTADELDRYECVVDFVYRARTCGHPLVQAARARHRSPSSTGSSCSSVKVRSASSASRARPAPIEADAAQLARPSDDASRRPHLRAVDPVEPGARRIPPSRRRLTAAAASRRLGPLPDRRARRARLHRARAGAAGDRGGPLGRHPARARPARGDARSPPSSSRTRSPSATGSTTSTSASSRSTWPRSTC